MSFRRRLRAYAVFSAEIGAPKELVGYVDEMERRGRALEGFPSRGVPATTRNLAHAQAVEEAEWGRTPKAQQSQSAFERMISGS